MKNLRIHIGLILAVISIFVSCDSEDYMFEQKSQNETCANFLKISPDEAIKIAFKAVYDVSDNNTRTVRSVNSIELLRSDKTRSGNGNIPDSALYVINFNDNEGFALVAADRRLRPFYAVSDEGNLNLSDTIENKSLALVLNNIYAETVCLMDTFPIVGGVGGWNGHTPGILPDKPITSGYIKDLDIRPLIKECVRNYWDQTSPFNKYCFTSDGKPAYVGCTAIAVGMIMSYFEWPQEIAGRQLNWAMMKNYYGSDDLYFFLRELGKKSYLDIKYGAVGASKGSSASISNYPRTFNKLGYSKPESMTDFDRSFAITSLNLNKSPLLVNSHLTNATEESAHAWIIDGVVGFTSDGSVRPSSAATQTRYFHCVWGWSGSSDGYYVIESGRIASKPLKYNENDETVNEDPTVHLDFKVSEIKLMGNFKPNK